MTEILSWVIGIVIRTGIICALWIVVKHVIRSGGGTLKELLMTTTMAIRYGCLKLRAKLVDKLRENAEEKKETEEQNGHGVKAEGTVV